MTLERGALMALPPKPGEVTEAGAPLIWAWTETARKSTTAKAVKNATEGENEERTGISYFTKPVMMYLADRARLLYKIATEALRMHAEYNSLGSRARARILRRQLRDPFGSAQGRPKEPLFHSSFEAPLLRELYEHDSDENTSNADNNTR